MFMKKENWNYKVYYCGEKEVEPIKTAITNDLNTWLFFELCQKVNWKADIGIRWDVWDLVKKKRLELSGK